MQPGIPSPALTKSLKGHLTWKFNQTTSTVIPPQPLHFRKASSVSDILIFIADESKKKKKRKKKLPGLTSLCFSVEAFIAQILRNTQQTNKQIKKAYFLLLTITPGFQ